MEHGTWTWTWTWTWCVIWCRACTGDSAGDPHVEGAQRKATRRPPEASWGGLRRAGLPGHRGAVSNQQRHWDEQVPASMERIHGLHDDVRTRGVAREAVEHAFERADESRVAYDPHS